MNNANNEEEKTRWEWRTIANKEVASIATIDKALGRYYQSQNVNYYDQDGGIFACYCEDYEYDTDQFKEDLDGEPECASFLECLEETFPCDDQSEPKEELIFDTMAKIYANPNIIFSSPIPNSYDSSLLSTFISI